MNAIKWLHEPVRWEILNRTPKVDYKNLFNFKITIKM